MHIWMPTIETGTGAEVYVRRLADGLIARGHEVTLDLAPHVFQYCPWLAPISCPERCDLIVANSWSAPAFAVPGVPLVTILHHVVHQPAPEGTRSLAQQIFHRGFVLPMEKSALRQSKRVVVVSETTATATRAVFGQCPLFTVLNGVDTDFFRPDGKCSTGKRADPVRLLFVGKPSRRKGFDIVIDLVRELGDDADLTLVGPEGESGFPDFPATRLGRISREALREAYRAADFLLLPSRVEGFGYAAAEAMACGTPVACLAEGAVAEVVSPPRGGVAIDPGDIAGSAKAMRRIKADPVAHGDLRIAARAIALDRFSEERWLDEMEGVLLGAADSSQVP